MKREVDYTWRLAELMAAHGMHNSTDLIPRLAERGIQLSRPQVYRVVHQRPERVSLQLMAALCDILGCGVEDLVTVTAKKSVLFNFIFPPFEHDVVVDENDVVVV